MNRDEAIETGKFIKALIGIADVSIILDNFISAIKNKSFEHDNQFYLCGNLKFGPQSGRLSSADPNLQNLPSKGPLGKLIKSCVIAPEGWLFAGADFNALEDRIGAILSKDKNKTKEFSEGFDGHSLRSQAFFSGRIHPELQKFNPEDPGSINQIKSEFPEYRNEAKAPSFALQYGGTYRTLVSNLGLPIDVSQEIEKQYRKLYAGIETFNKENTQFAKENGYVECAFGLRLRTPVLEDIGNSGGRMTFIAESESRSAGNAVTQSWGMLMNRALIATEKRIRESEFDKDILACNTIHDAGYFLIRKIPEVVQWLNETLIEEMEWQAHPLIQSDNVLLGAELDIGKSWDKLITLPNKATITEIKECIGAIK